MLAACCCSTACTSILGLLQLLLSTVYQNMKLDYLPTGNCSNSSSQVSGGESEVLHSALLIHVTKITAALLA
jgi:hypothetical protein